MKKQTLTNRFELLDAVIVIILTFYALIIIIPFVNVVAISFSTQREYLDTPVLLFPKMPTISNYTSLFRDGRILIGYRTTLIFLTVGMPINMILTTSIAYGLSRPSFPLKKFFIYMVIVTMLFNGGIIPLYLLIRQLKLTNTIWSVILSSAINSFYLIIMRNYFRTLPESIIESAKLDGASEIFILWKIILPVSMPIIATIMLFYSVDRWNEWFHPMMFIRRNSLVSLQLVLRGMVMEKRIDDVLPAGTLEMIKFSDGMKMSAVMVTMLPIMLVFPFLQKHFAKGIFIGAIKA
jgi:putative aldouronate transport system permease protein